MPSCSRPSRTLCAAKAVAAKSGSSLTATAHDGRHRVQVGTEGWFQSNKRIDPENRQEASGAAGRTILCAEPPIHGLATLMSGDRGQLRILRAPIEFTIDPVRDAVLRRLIDRPQLGHLL